MLYSSEAIATRARDDVTKVTNRQGKVIIPDAGYFASMFLNAFPKYYSSSGYPHTMKEFKGALSYYKRVFKTEVKKQRRLGNPTFPKNRWIKAKAIKLHRNGMMSVRVSNPTRHKSDDPYNPFTSRYVGGNRKTKYYVVRGYRFTTKTDAMQEAKTFANKSGKPAKIYIRYER